MDSQSTENKASSRLIALDAFRGLTIAAMILVNFPGNGDAVYAPLEHAAWNGITPTDLIFPFFLFIVGVAIAFSYTKRLESGLPMGRVYGKLILRAVKIFMLGLLLNFLSSFNFHDLRIAGVLSRISIVFLACGFLFLKTSWKTQVITGAVLLIAYWLAMTLIPTPTFGKVMLEPGKNLAAWFDSKYLPGKMWQGSWDPEGLLSTVPAFATTIAGMLTGSFLLTKKSWEQKVIYLFAAGFILTILGSVWSWTFPLNKNLWTSSFVLYTAGLALMTLATMIFLIDIQGYKKWTGFAVIYGSNAITIYVLADFLYIVFYVLKIGGSSLNMHFFNFFSDTAGLAPKFVSMLYALLFVGVNFIPAYLLHRKKIFIKL
jgi:predicted acyltransferase